ncbi:MAG: hypothetical protein EZS28_016070 [Streblomastix strix]|uniref:Uncharacterized protein n=1 Tax=Streblomastix strix TaxID=222440 RepID=A0A5J4W0D2_9EUKA|nr:MAG: hypothetical protein EZS28_016070 [Streblomastix strix]
MTNKGIITSDDCNEPSQEQKDLIENNDFGVMVRGDFSGMNKADLLQLDQLTFNAAYVQFDKKEQDVGSKDSFAFAYFWNKEEAEIDPQFNKEDIDTKFNQEDIARQIDPDDEYKTLVVDLTSRPKARLMKKYLSNKQEFKEQQKRVSWADHELLCNCFHIMFDNRLHNYKCNDLTFNEEVVKDAFYQKFHTNVDRVELYFKSDGVLKGDGLLFFENTLDGERTAINALNQSKEMRFVDIGYIRVSFEEKADKFGQKQERRRFFWPWMNNNKQDGAFDNVKGRSWHNHSYQQDQNQTTNANSSVHELRYNSKLCNELNE